MKILTFAYEQGGWTLEPVTFGDFNLLVGISGAGKTRIVQALERVFAFAMGPAESGRQMNRLLALRGARFAMTFEHEGQNYEWRASIDQETVERSTEENLRAPALAINISRESLRRDGNSLIDRNAERFLFSGEPIPRLDRAQSALSLLREDPTVAPLHQALSRCLSSLLVASPSHGVKYSGATGWMAGIRAVEESASPTDRYRTVVELGSDFGLNIHHKAELLKQLFPDSFAQIDRSFREAFPNILSLGVQREESPVQADGGVVATYVSLTANEPGVSPHLPFHQMSSGMQRYLSFLVHLSFAPKGTVVLIDELEASFGINCLPAAVQFLMARAPDLQFILTSHHPYIVQQIPPEYWKVVTRRGSQVRVLDASTLPALAPGRSRLDNFTRLINLPEYEHGVQ